MWQPPRTRRRKGNSPCGGGSPHWCLDWSAAATTTQLCLASCSVSSSANGTSRCRRSRLITPWSCNDSACLGVAAYSGEARGATQFSALAAWRPCLRDDSELVGGIDNPDRGWKACARADSRYIILRVRYEYQDFRTVPQSSPVFEFCEVFKTCQPTRNLASWNFQILTCAKDSS